MNQSTTNTGFLLTNGFRVIDLNDANQSDEVAEWLEVFNDEREPGRYYPDEWLRVLLAAVIKRDLHVTKDVTSPSIMLQYICKHLSIQQSLLFDHQFATRSSLIGEPYWHGDNDHYDKLLANAKKLAEFLDVWLVINEPASHNEHCVRFRFQTRQIVDEDYVKTSFVDTVCSLVQGFEWEASRRLAYQQKLTKLDCDPDKVYSEFCEETGYDQQDG